MSLAINLDRMQPNTQAPVIADRHRKPFPYHTEGTPAPGRRPDDEARDDGESVARVLLAEDDSAMRQMLVEALEEEGYLVTEVANGRHLAQCLTGPQSASSQGPDIVISDIRMPGHNGLDVLAALRQRDWATPVILITAFGDDDTHREAKRLGAVTVLDKPFDVDDLLAVVRDIVPPIL